MRRALRSGAGLALLCGFVATSCEAPSSSLGCGQDTDCAPSQACFARACIARVRFPYVAAFRLSGRLGGASASTDLPAETILDANAPLVLSPPVSLTGRAESLATAPFAKVGEGQLSLSFRLPPVLPNGPERQTSLIAEVKNEGGVVPFALAVPQGWVGQTARVFVTPRAPVDLVLPPVEQEVLLGPDMKIDLPGAQELRAVEGLVRNEFDQAVPGYVVRVMRGTSLVSSRALPAAEDGRFRVSFPKQGGPPAGELPATLVIAVAGAGARPQIRLVLGDNVTDVGTVRLPPHPLPRPFRIPVALVDAEARRLPVVGATVRLETRIMTSGPGATAIFVQEAQSGLDGVAQMSLIPGGIENAQHYTMQIVTPSGAPAASTCVDNFAVGAVGAAEPTPTTATVELARRPVLSGRVQLSDGTAVPAAVVTAFRTASLPGLPACDALAFLGPTSVNTDERGSFEMQVEPGVYRIEIRPPAGARSALFAEAGVAVTGEGLQRDFVMREGLLLEARVLDTTGGPCAQCQVAVYDPAGGEAPLRAEAITDAEGRFRTVVPPP